ncbi:MAG: DNA polymerase III subunit delta [Candidatus Protistobacter heckmanni]|nr:DNA polymerase III subunit delta [Candidatus Protistobacter heckmanni]
MQLRPEALAQHLAQPRLAPIYVLHGDEHLLVLEAVDAIRKAARAHGYSEREVHTAERGFAWADLLNAGQSMSLFGDRKLVELRIPTGKPGKEGGQAIRDYAAAQLQNADPDTVTLVTLPRLDMTTQKSAWFAALEAAGVGVKIDLVDRSRLPQWISARLAAQQQKVPTGEAGRRALQFIADKVEGNLLAAHQEIQKLGLLFPAGEISFEQIQDAVLNVARYDVFKLSEAMLSGDMARLARMLDGLRGEGESHVLALWAMTEEIRVLCKVRKGLDEGKPMAQLLRDNRVWGARERLVPDALGRLDARRLRAALSLSSRLDRLAKGLREPELPANVWDGLLDLGLMMK